ncbi:deoxyguanosinetriphosphate triphosphohydrolase [Vallicoccus soli]|uniref:deoxyguanosinetriphosphate triphosphohydrolase n=1 Tax=Vallicoccus soli TaxID=2339232 RepID=UPI0015AEA02D|nr:deoxyguanosinetriphosphate triphosphohydrolase [Vallicoccus soli]
MPHSPAAPYDGHARARWAPEPPKQSARGDFARDRARVVHSSALRRLAGKTQVVGPTSDDFVRNRLTHTLEVAQVGRDLGAALGCDPDVVETACLAHDLGHPPFGHNGEVALDEAAAPCGGFEGNAHTLRLLTRLEAKTTGPGGRSTGLNLTRASLDAATKYPWGRERDRRKYGVFAEDREVFAWLRAGAPDGRRCVEAQVMDWADDVAYSVHDVEDAVQSGAVDLRALRDPAERAVLARVARDAYAPDAAPEDLLAALDRLLALPWWPGPYDGSRRALAGLKELTSRLVGRFTGAAEAATRATHGGGPLTRYAADLVVPPAARLEVAVLKGVAAHWVMRAERHLAVLAGQRALLAELVERLEAGAPAALAPVFRADWAAAGDDAARRRVVVDQVASLTDPSAVALHRALTAGPGVPGPT